MTKLVYFVAAILAALASSINSTPRSSPMQDDPPALPVCRDKTPCSEEVTLTFEAYGNWLCDPPPSTKGWGHNEALTFTVTACDDLDGKTFWVMSNQNCSGNQICAPLIGGLTCGECDDNFGSDPCQTAHPENCENRCNVEILINNCIPATNGKVTGSLPSDPGHGKCECK